MQHPLRFPTVARPLLSLLHHSRVNLVDCCVLWSIGGRLKPRRILFYFFFCLKIRWPKRLDGVLPYRLRPARRLSHIHPTDGVAFWLVVTSSYAAGAIEIRGPIALSIFIFLCLNSPPKTMGKHPPPRVPPVRIASPKLPPPPTPSFGWLSRFPLEWRPPKTGAPPTLNSSMGAILAPQTNASKAARASPGAGRLYEAHEEARRRD